MTETSHARAYAGIVASAVTLARGDVRLVLGALAVFTALFTFSDTLDENLANPIIVIGSLTMLYVQLIMTFRALHRIGLSHPGYDPRQPTSGRFPSAFGQSLLWTMAVLAGLIALVVPGVVLISRWLVALPTLAAESESITGSLARSWVLSRGRFPLVLMLSLTGVLLAVPAILLIWAIEIKELIPRSLFTIILTNFMINIASLFMTFITVAAYQNFRQNELPRQTPDPVPPPAQHVA